MATRYRQPPAPSFLSALLAPLSLLLFTIVACGAPRATETSAPVEGEHQTETQALSAVSLPAGDRLLVVATTSIVADVVKNVGGDAIVLTTLMPLGTDPHAFEPTPQDVAAVSDAHVIFAAGAGLEAFLEPLLVSAEAETRTVYVSDGVALRELEDRVTTEEDHEDDADPHTWTDPNKVMTWTHNIERALSTLDPGNADLYEARAGAYVVALTELDGWIQQQVSHVPEVRRRIVTDHATFGYFAERYGFELVGALIPGYSTLSEPSAQELAELQDAIRELQLEVVFVGNTVNPNLARRVSEDLGVQLVFLYTGSLSEPGGPAGSYLEFMRYNVSQIVNALK